MFSLPKLIVIGLLIFVGYSLFKKKGNPIEGKKSGKSEEDAVDMVKCGSCGTFTEKESGYKVKLYDNYYTFCSEDCRKKFIDEKSSGE